MIGDHDYDKLAHMMSAKPPEFRIPDTLIPQPPNEQEKGRKVVKKITSLEDDMPCGEASMLALGQRTLKMKVGDKPPTRVDDF